MTAVSAAMHPFKVPLRSPLTTKSGTIRHREGFLVSFTSCGITGWGEASPLPGWSKESLQQTEAALWIAVTCINAIGDYAELRAPGTRLPSIVASLERTPHAQAGFAGAWMDLLAQQEQRSVSELTLHRMAGQGHAIHNREPAKAVRVNALISGNSPSDVETAASAAAALGYNAVKLKVGITDPKTDISRVSAARSAIGPDCELRLDANGAWDVGAAIDVLSSVKHLDIAFCEEPTNDVVDTDYVGTRSGVTVAVDESALEIDDYLYALEIGIEVVIVKPQALGTISESWARNICAHDEGARVIVTSFLDSAIGVAHALHFAACIDPALDTPEIHGLATSALLADDIAEPFAVVDGTISVPAGPGLGISPKTLIA